MRFAPKPQARRSGLKLWLQGALQWWLGGLQLLSTTEGQRQLMVPEFRFHPGLSFFFFFFFLR